jgi:hypothetical protein
MIGSGSRFIDTDFRSVLGFRIFTPFFTMFHHFGDIDIMTMTWTTFTPKRSFLGPEKSGVLRGSGIWCLLQGGDHDLQLQHREFAENSQAPHR